MPVHTKKDGRVFVVYYDGDGKRIWESFGRGREAKDKAETRDLEIKLAKKRSQPAAIRHNPNLISFSELFQSYIAARCVEIRERTLAEIIRSVNTYVLPHIGQTAIGAIRPFDYSVIRDGMIAAKLSPQSINKYFHYTQKVFSWAMESGMMDDDPWRKQKRLRVVDKFKIDLFTMKDFEAILKVAPDHLAWTMEMAYHTGCRPGPSELFSLQWSDVDWKKRGIKILATKTNTIRWQYVSKAFLKRMKDRQKKQAKEYPDCPYICHYEGARIRSLKRSWGTAKDEAKVTRPIRLYDIRHFHITYALAAGADIMDLANRVGHVNADMIVNIYAHLAKDLQTRDAAKIPGYDFKPISSAVPTPEERQLRSPKRAEKEAEKLAMVDKNSRQQQKGVSDSSLTP
jgi:integrase